MDSETGNPYASPNEYGRQRSVRSVSMKLPKAILRGIGMVSILLALVGLFYNATTISTDFSRFHDDRDVAFFYPAFYTMSAISISSFVLLLVLGIQFLRIKPGVVRVFVLLLVFEVLYMLAIGPMLFLLSGGRSIGGATALANGGMMFQAFILFPIWAIPASLWAGRKLSESNLEPILASRR